jgi:thiol-disulfide isomerase/thioredoxin
MWKAFRSVALVLLISTPAFASQAPHKAEETLKTAKLKAAAENKAILLIFGASWCEACHQLDSFLGLPEIAPIFDKYFVIARITFGEAAAGHPEWDDPGSDTLLIKYGAVYAGGTVDLPFMALLDAKAKLIVNSNRAVKGDSTTTGIGFPSEAADMRFFLGMLQKAAPNLTEAEAHKIQEGLQKASAD